MKKLISPDDIIQFWYAEPMSLCWFKSTPDIDQLIKEKYRSLWCEAAAGKMNAWKQTAEGCLALILLFDQFPLNMFRGTAESFSTETQAIELTLYGIEQGYDTQLAVSQLNFFYMPLMHSESIEHQKLSVEKFIRVGLDANVRFAEHHRDIIERFGRFPHRNMILDRESSPAELDYLTSKEAFTG